ncbi:hypothetical protein ABIF86_000255 [Bradyrhizobium japonicum]
MASQTQGCLRKLNLERGTPVLGAPLRGSLLNPATYGQPGFPIPAYERKVIGLSSDTVIQPTQPTRQVMFDAELGASGMLRI